MSAMRRNIASRLQASKQEAPHFRLVMDCDMEAIMAKHTVTNGDRPAGASPAAGGEGTD